MSSRRRPKRNWSKAYKKFQSSRPRTAPFRKGYDRRAVGYYRDAGDRKELKFHDQDIDDAVVAAAGTIFTNGSAEASLVRIAQGDGESERLGRKCTVKSINWRFRLLLPIAVTNNSKDIVRVILYLDSQCNGTAATALEILETDDFQSFNNLANSSRFRTLMDRTYDMNPAGMSGDGTTIDSAPYIVSDTFFKKCNIMLEYDNAAATGALATVRSNNINMLILSESGLVGFASKMRIRFTG